MGVPLAARTGVGTVAVWMECIWWLSLVQRNVAVAPESRMAVVREGAVVNELGDNKDLVQLSLFVTSPACHSSQKQFLVEPPCMSVKVAVVLWPGEGC